MSQPMPHGYPAPGEVVDGKYQIERMLGEGGMGAVARAHHLHLRSSVALKFMNPQFAAIPGAVDRFFNEGVAASKIQSEHIVRVFDVCRAPSGAPCLVMECLDGADLAAILEQSGPLPIGRALHFTLQILRGLQVAHAAGVVHRDMKPSNCFVVSKDGEADFIKLLDFGISKVVEPGSISLTRTHSALGTPLYMSPEQAKSPRDVDPRSDLYSVGVILYELLTGVTPFTAESGELTELLFKLFSTEPDPIQSKRPDLPPELARAIHAALVRDPNQRFPNALAMAEALAPFAMPQSVAVVEKMRAFVPGERTSYLPSSRGAPLIASGNVQSPPSVLEARSRANIELGSAATHYSAAPPPTGAQPAAPQVFGIPAPVAPLAPPAPHAPGVAVASTNMDAVHTASHSLPPKRSNVIYLVGGACFIAVVATVAVSANRPHPAPPTVGPDLISATNGPNTATVLPPAPSAALPVPSAVASASAAPSASASAKPKARPHTPQTTPTGDFGLGAGIHQ